MTADERPPLWPASDSCACRTALQLRPYGPLPGFHSRALAGFLASLLGLTGLLTTGCGGGGDGAPAATGLAKEETFWDDAKEMPKVSATTRYGKYVGEYTARHQNGQVAVRGNYDDDGLKTGKWEENYPSGRPLSLIVFAASQMRVFASRPVVARREPSGDRAIPSTGGTTSSSVSSR